MNDIVTAARTLGNYQGLIDTTGPYRGFDSVIFGILATTGVALIGLNAAHIQYHCPNLIGGTMCPPCTGFMGGHKEYRRLDVSGFASAW